MKKFRFTDSHILAVLKQAEAGTPVPQLCREQGISSATFYKWRSKFGDMDAPLMSQLKELQDENRRLKKMYADAQLSAELLKEAIQTVLAALPLDQGSPMQHEKRLRAEPAKQAGP